MIEKTKHPPLPLPRVVGRSPHREGGGLAAWPGGPVRAREAASWTNGKRLNRSGRVGGGPNSSGGGDGPEAGGKGEGSVPGYCRKESAAARRAGPEGL